MKLYYFIVRDKISLGRPVTDNDLKALDCYYKSPVFSWDDSPDSLQAILNDLESNFSHFFDWCSELVVAKQCQMCL